jgi:nucleoside-diphosphate-sugar epimerase
MKIAVIGASGFVGSRFLEHCILRRSAEVVPVVRSFSSLAVLSRFDLPWKVCDVMNPDSLAKSLEGCDAVVHAALGDPAQIVRMAGSVYAAAEKAGIRRLVALSSAAVHSLNPASGTDEGTPILDRQAMDYNNAKVRAEQVLRKARERGKVELVMLRPSIVYGPRCRLIAGLVEKLIARTAFLVNEGSGICNGIYVDNLIEAILLAVKCADADGESFLVSDAETVTWREVYETLADALGVGMDTVHRVAPPAFRKSFKERVEGLVATPLAQLLLPAFPGQAKRLTKVMLGALKPPQQPNAWALPAEASALVDEEMATLQQCAWKLPNQKAAKILGFEPSVSFVSGMNRTKAWLKFAGYPLLDSWER